MMDAHRKAHIDEQFASWRNCRPKVPANGRDWSIEDAAAVGHHIRDYDVMMHRLGLCPPKGGNRKGARDLCCHICEAAIAAKKQPRKP